MESLEEPARHMCCAMPAGSPEIQAAVIESRVPCKWGDTAHRRRSSSSCRKSATRSAEQIRNDFLALKSILSPRDHAHGARHAIIDPAAGGRSAGDQDDPQENRRVCDRARAYVGRSTRSARGPQLVLSRTAPASSPGCSNSSARSRGGCSRSSASRDPGSRRDNRSALQRPPD